MSEELRREHTTEATIQKKRRKGTHSCSECRRKKVRCVYLPGYPTLCARCAVRGTACVGQDPGHSTDASVLFNKNKALRERLARAEALLDALMINHPESASKLLQGMGQSHLAQGYQAEPSILNEIHSDIRNLSFGIADLENLDHGRDRLPHPRIEMSGLGPFVRSDSPSSPVASLDFRGTGVSTRLEAARIALLTFLPSKPELVDIIRANTADWFLRWDKQHCASYSMGHDTFEAFATHAVTKGTPIDIAILLICLLTNTPEDSSSRFSTLQDFSDNALLAIDRWVIGDDFLMSTLDGLECAFLLATYYGDFGHLRKSWLLVRRTLCSAQMMNLHKQRVNRREESIWWWLYQHDRFASLLLGVPHGIPDSVCSMSYEGKYIKNDTSIKGFTRRVAQATARIIEETRGVQISETAVAEVEGQLTELANDMGPEFWERPHRADLRDLSRVRSYSASVAGQIVYYLVKVLLYVPFMLKSIHIGGYEQGRLSCFSNAREALTVYNLIRSPEMGLHTWKGFDFGGFMSAAVMALHLLSYNKIDPQQDHDDWKAIDRTLDIFKAGFDKKGKRNAQVCFQGLYQLVQLRSSEDDGGRPLKADLLYFGTVAFRRPTKAKQTTSKTKAHPSFPAAFNQAMPAMPLLDTTQTLGDMGTCGIHNLPYIASAEHTNMRAVVGGLSQNDNSALILRVADGGEYWPWINQNMQTPTPQFQHQPTVWTAENGVVLLPQGSNGVQDAVVPRSSSVVSQDFMMG